MTIEKVFFQLVLNLMSNFSWAILRMVAFGLLATFSIFSCGGGEPGPSSVGVSPEENTESLSTYYVSVDAGVDNVECGFTRSLPCHSITYAINNIPKDSYTLVVSPGVYNNSFESFPVEVSGNIELIGEVDEDADGGKQFAIVSGSGLYSSSTNISIKTSFVLRDGAQVKNIVVESEEASAFVFDNATSVALVQNVAIEKCERGVLVLGSSEGRVINSTIKNCITTAIETRDTSSLALLGNIISENNIGVIIDGFSEGEFKENKIKENILCDFLSRSEVHIDLIGNDWDENVFKFTPDISCDFGKNIVLEGLGSVVYQLIPSQNVPFYPGTSLLGSLTPRFGEFISDKTPSIEFYGVRNKLSAVAILTAPPDTTSVGIKSAENIVWFWHSGLNTGSIGRVSYSDGGKPSESDLTVLEDPEPLQSDVTYYWIVWEWDAEGLAIVRSTQLNYFIVN